MSITDELRKWAKGSTLSSWTAEHLTAIADRIDAEHEAKVSYWQGASYKDGYDEGFASADDWLAQHEDAMSEHGWIRLPLDADGVPWNPGDRDEDGNEVTELRLTSSGWCVLTDDEWPYRPERHRHYHAPTVENVLREFTDAILEWSGKSGTVAEVGTWSDVAAKYAKRLTLAEVEDA